MVVTKLIAMLLLFYPQTPANQSFSKKVRTYPAIDGICPYIQFTLLKSAGFFSPLWNKLRHLQILFYRV